MTLMTRRSTLGLATSVAAGGLSRPALAQSSAAVLRFVPQSDLPMLDPIFNVSYVVRNHGYLVFDTLFALDSGFKVRPQMAEGYDVSDDGKNCTIRLRDGLRFHDGAPVLARDCVASIRRWATRDGFGQTLMGQTDELSAVDDRTIRFRLKAPFPLLPDALGKLSNPVAFMMPERMALIDANQPVKEAIGSGPFRFLPGEWHQGVGAIYEKFDSYVPRQEKADGMAGGKVVHVSRVEWRTIPDTSTAMSALQTGQVDWLEVTSPDLLSLVASNNAIAVTTFDPIGTYVLLRFNSLVPPFNDPAIKRAVLRGIKQADYLETMVGNPKLYRECKAFFPCGTPLSTGAGSSFMTGNLDDARALLKASKYDGRKVVVLAACRSEFASIFACLG